MAVSVCRVAAAHVTWREAQVKGLLAQGLRIGDVAELLRVHPRQVEALAPRETRQMTPPRLPPRPMRTFYKFR